MMKNILFLLPFFLVPMTTQGQQVLSSASGSGTIGAIRIDHTLGEMVAIQTIQTSTNIVTQGYHQPYRLFVSVVEMMPPDALQIFPNPTALHLNLNMHSESAKHLQLRLLDNSGRVTLESEWQLGAGQNTTQIELHNQPSGIYYLQCIDAKTQQKGLWKVVKTQD
jgi:hypothetical protein